METTSKGIWIPEELFQNEELTIMEKLFVVKISGLDGDDGCYASNRYFAEYFKLSRSRCSIIIKSLKDKGYIFIKYYYEKGKSLIERRVIKVKTNVVKEIKKSIDTAKELLGNINKLESNDTSVDNSITELLDDPSTNLIEVSNSDFKTIEEEFGEKVTQLDILDEIREVEVVSSHNKLKVKGVDKEKNSKNSLHQEIIGYLNTKCKTNYKYTTRKTQRYINARIREGYILDDFRKVIDKKYEEWHKSSMKIYLRPETLFGGKFERYLNEETKVLQNHFNNTKWIGGQAYGEQFKNVRNSGENKGNEKKSSFSHRTPLTKEEREWAERELF